MRKNDEVELKFQPGDQNKSGPNFTVPN